MPETQQIVACDADFRKIIEGTAAWYEQAVFVNLISYPYYHDREAQPATTVNAASAPVRFKTGVVSRDSRSFPEAVRSFPVQLLRERNRGERNYPGRFCAPRCGHGPVYLVGLH